MRRAGAGALTDPGEGVGWLGSLAAGDRSGASPNARARAAQQFPRVHRLHEGGRKTLVGQCRGCELTVQGAEQDQACSGHRGVASDQARQIRVRRPRERGVEKNRVERIAGFRRCAQGAKGFVRRCRDRGAQLPRGEMGLEDPAADRGRVGDEHAPAGKLRRDRIGRRPAHVILFWEPGGEPKR